MYLQNAPEMSFHLKQKRLSDHFCFFPNFYIFHQVNFLQISSFHGNCHLSALYDSSGMSKEEVNMRSQSLWFTTGDRRGWLRGSIKTNPEQSRSTSVLRLCPPQVHDRKGEEKIDNLFFKNLHLTNLDQFMVILYSNISSTCN